MSLKSEYTIKKIIYAILAIVIYLTYINLNNKTELILLGIIIILLFILIFLQNKTSKMNIILNSIYDNKTKLYNRQYFIAELNTTYERAIRYDSPISIMLIVIENLQEFKIKERDYILKIIGNFMLKHSRDSDIICRYDDDRIIVLLPMTDYLHAIIARDRFKNGLLNIDFETIQKPIFKFHVTQNQEDENSDEFLIRALDGH
jgi:diguanylate cyclase (GGDEF)-like protein